MSDQDTIKLKRAWSLKKRIIFLTSAILIIGMLAVTVIGVYNTNRLFINSVRNQAHSNVEIVANLIDNTRLEKLVTEKDVNDPYYKELFDMLHTIKTNSKFIYLYIVEDVDTENVRFIMDASSDWEDEYYVGLGELDSKEYYLGIDKAFSSNTYQFSDIYDYLDEDINHKIISCYYPLKDSNGNLIAILGGDIEVSDNIKDFNGVVKQFAVVYVSLLLVSLILTIIIAMRMIKPLNEIVTYVNDISTGNFTLKYNYFLNNEPGKINKSIHGLIISLKKMFSAVNSTADNIKLMTKTVDISTSQLAASSQNIVANFNTITQAVNSESRDTQSGLTNMNDLNEAIQRASSNVNDLMNSLESINQSKNAGLESVNMLTEESFNTNAALKEVSANIQLTNESVSKIGATSSVIKGIATQTNLLALNASIEASRAGEAGRGFAVVAGEIKKLAEQSNASIGEINEILDKLVLNSSNTLITMEGLESTMEKQILSVNKTGDGFRQINEEINRIEDYLKRLKRRTTQIEKTRDTVLTIFQSIAESAESNAAAIEEVAADLEEQTCAMDEISNMTTTMTKSVNTLEEALNVFQF